MCSPKQWRGPGQTICQIANPGSAGLMATSEAKAEYFGPIVWVFPLWATKTYGALGGGSRYCTDRMTSALQQDFGPYYSIRCDFMPDVVRHMLHHGSWCEGESF